jgi:GntR family transcriptional regulator
VGPEHILLGLLRDPEGRAPGLLQRLGVDPAALEEGFRASLPPGKAPPRAGELPYTSWAKTTLERAIAEARAAGESAVEDEDLLVALSTPSRRGVTGAALHEAGATAEAIRRLRRGGAAPLPPESDFAPTIDDTSDRPIYLQIVKQVKEAVATGALGAGDRLPTVRRLADRLDIAPGTVSRAYQELEAAGVVVTEGARGTRVAPEVPSPRPDPADPAALAGLLRSVVVAAFHLGADRRELEEAFARAMDGIFENPGAQGRRRRRGE